MKDCFGKIIKDSGKLDECRTCEYLEECKAINWPPSAPENGQDGTRQGSARIQQDIQEK